MEAAATGVPVVATDIRGCRDTVIEGETGHLVPVRDPTALAAAIIDVLRDEGRRWAMGTRARALAEERFDQRRVFERVADAYAALEGKPK
jgi:glycosyltransferase involved in cell wall biosynthesis